MKTKLISILLLVGANVFASTEAELIYNALNVQEKPIAAERTQLKYQKYIDGLLCLKTNDIRVGNSFSCSLSISNIDNEVIYSTLNIEEESLPAERTKLKYKKSVSILNCIKTNDLLKGDSVACSISI